jgi:hypothetical protein
MSHKALLLKKYKEAHLIIMDSILTMTVSIFCAVRRGGTP